MHRRPSSRPVRVLAAALAAGTLLTCAACSGGSGGGAGGDGASDIAASPLAARSPLASPRTGKSASPVLTEAGARAALITEADLEDNWTQVKDAAGWGDKLVIGKVDVGALLTAKTNAVDCQKLLDALYGDDLLGKPSGASALTGFEQSESRLLYQVAAYDRARLGASLNWLKTLPVKCDQFTATDSKGGRRTVQVIEDSVPSVGDARQGLQVTVTSTGAAQPTTLTLQLAVVRVGTDAITVTSGGLNGTESGTTKAAVEQGTSRLKDVLAGRTPPAQPGNLG
ncbi:hypothetical protein SAMN05216489_01742 [Streptomyces sp. 3213]|uniref:hypothetical protein n=1 Tax=Streptomyces sp. 3213.3 TaxID=1855348 RepID=UPI000895BE30|nr:hypothetical protein [Streptomyces sp. 3213.3]SEC83115.1 hypothetical protein SAMN05216489_01742 [Streptomyces sp. 3213] [Streptomyces sp. 3213.3]